MSSNLDVSALWDQIIDGYRGRGPIRIETVSADPNSSEAVELDLSTNAFFLDSRYAPSDGDAEGACLLGDGASVFSWDPYRPSTYRRDVQPGNLSDTLHTAIGVVLDKSFRSNAHRVTIRSDTTGVDFLFNGKNDTFVARFEGALLTMVGSWMEAPDGTRLLQRRYRTTPIRTLTGRLPEGSTLSEAGWGTDKLYDPTNRTAAPDLDALTLSGERITWEEFLGRPVVVEFWATWCGKCRPKLDHLNALRGEFGDRVGIVSISLDTDEAMLRAFVSARQLQFPVIIDGAERSVGRSWGVSGVPTVVVVDQRRGVVCIGHAVSRSALRFVLSRILSEQTIPPIQAS